MKDYLVDDIKNIVRPQLGEEVPLVLFRILRIIGMRSILGETSGATLYMMGKKVGNMLQARTMEEFSETIRQLKIGIPEVVTDDEDHITVKLFECLTCAGFPNTGEMFCDMESGIIAGLLENVHGKKAKSTQTKSWSVGFNYCEFEVFLY
ncbi:MAG: V4R domain protein [Syntrophorhabdus sp. PtaB.Bin047]|jgi:predicted hydrocarbon binding protein|nr:MAG: V4R domain protein [Syntrophorhabdus sp. PtaB.Bin047]